MGEEDDDLYSKLMRVLVSVFKTSLDSFGKTGKNNYRIFSLFSFFPFFFLLCFISFQGDYTYLRCICCCELLLAFLSVVKRISKYRYAPVLRDLS